MQLEPVHLIYKATPHAALTGLFGDGTGCDALPWGKCHALGARDVRHRSDSAKQPACSTAKPHVSPQVVNVCHQRYGFRCAT